MKQEQNSSLVGTPRDPVPVADLVSSPAKVSSPAC